MVQRKQGWSDFSRWPGSAVNGVPHNIFPPHIRLQLFISLCLPPPKTLHTWHLAQRLHWRTPFLPHLRRTNRRRMRNPRAQRCITSAARPSISRRRSASLCMGRSQG